MDWKINTNAVNQLVKGTEIYQEGDPVFSVALILKGRVLIQNEGAKVIVSTGTFLGINDLYTGRFQSTYSAYDDLLLYVFAINRTEELDQILSINKDYHGFMVASYNKLIYELDYIYQGILKISSSLYQFLMKNYKDYINDSNENQKLAERRFRSITMPESDLELLRDRIDYYIECRNLPIDVVKAFYSYGNAITIYQVEDQANIINQQMEVLKKISKEMVILAECLVDDSNTSLFRLASMSAMGNDNDSSNRIMDIMDNIVDEINHTEKFAEQKLGRKFSVDRKMMEEVYHQLLTNSSAKDGSTTENLKYADEEISKALSEMKDSFQSILAYAGMEAEQAVKMQNTMTEFIDLKDKSALDDEARLIRRKLTDDFYDLYKIVFLKAYHNKETSRIIDLFLKYGFADERLLTKEQLLSLYYLKEEVNQGPCNIFNIKEWLTLIYEGKKEPSKNEFDLEYPEMVSGLKKQGKLSEKEVKEWLVNPDRKLEYEIQNMFRYNNRTTSGQITSFVPVLHKDAIVGELDRIFLTPSKVNNSVSELLRIDYTVFDREVLYVDNEKNIAKEYIVQRIYPDIILMPSVGSNGIMWQEITGKRRNSAGRFLLPIFSESDPMSLLVKIFGKFHWELCRTIEGSAWNDIKHKSLTSEYSDYLQFYRKNKDLSEEKKEKIKLQIQKGRNSSREIFVIDYEQWINYEAMGAIKLNKLVREMMATYCPFSREIRDQLKLQPLFEEAMARYYRNKQKKVREIESRYRMLQKEQVVLTKELEDTLSYYRDL